MSKNRSLGSILSAALRQIAGGATPPTTVSEGWEEYARRYAKRPKGHLGDEWSVPADIGLELPAGRELVEYLDERVFAPFLGTCDTILEIGSGGGRFTAILAPKCRRLIATDTAPSMVKALQKRFVQQPAIECRMLDGRGLGGVADASVDAVFSYDVFVHLQHWDIFNYLKETARVLKPGGKALIHHSNTLSPLGWRLFAGQVEVSLNRSKLPWTFSAMTPELMEEFVRRAGLTVERSMTDLVTRDAIVLLRKSVES